MIVSHMPAVTTVADRIMLLGDGIIEVFEPREVVLDAMRRRQIKTVQPAATASAAQMAEISAVRVAR